ncbi:MAG TPA: response regulator transcription factor [Candidatus Dormibacteraeota bacterium]|nr:response regulator transcription factor [Candidatus Dormibacteraeota bacterium]
MAESARARGIDVVLVEDHRIVREGTRSLLERDPAIRIAGEASRGEDALRLAEELRPQVMLVDVQLDGMNGIEVIRAVAERCPEVRCVVLSAFDDYVYVTEAFEAGAHGYLLKTAGATELVDAVHSVAGGATVTDEKVARRLLERWRRGGASQERLTSRETDVLRLLAQGLSNKQIAADLGVGLRTVEGHVSTLLAKCGVRSRTEAVLYAMTHHLVAAPGADTG